MKNIISFFTVMLVTASLFAQNVGIGTTTPETKLHIVGEDNNGTAATLKITSTNGTQNMLLDGNEIDGIDSLGLYLQNNVTFPLVLAQGGGNVGIGFTMPTDKLHVNGNIRVADDADMYGLDEVFGFNDLRLYGDPNIGPNNQADLLIGANGNVGIGIGNNVPTEKLQVQGNIRLADDSDIYGLDELKGVNDLRLFGDDSTGLSDLFIGTDGNVLVQNGNLGIATSSPSSKLQVNGKIQFAGLETLEDGGANEIAARGDVRPSVDDVYDLGTSGERWDDVYATNGTINTSDRRDKKNIQDLDYGLTEIMQLRPVRFEWKNNSRRGEKLGLIAQELQQVVGEVVKTHDFKATEDGGPLEKVELERLGVYYSDLIPVLIKGMQEQQEIIEELKQRIEKLENQ